MRVNDHKATFGKLILFGCVILAALLLWFFVSPILAVLVLGLSALAVGTFIATGISTSLAKYSTAAAISSAMTDERFGREPLEM